MATEETTAVQIIGRAVPFTKTAQKEAVDRLVAQVTEGEIDAVETFIKAKSLYETLGAFLKDKGVVDTTISECEKNGREGALYNGARMIVAEAGVRYDFSVCKDPKWSDLAAQKATIEAQLKERETFLRAIPGSQTIVNEETGEVVTVYPPAKTSSTTVKVTFLK